MPGKTVFQKHWKLPSKMREAKPVKIHCPGESQLSAGLGCHFPSAALLIYMRTNRGHAAHSSLLIKGMQTASVKSMTRGRRAKPLLAGFHPSEERIGRTSQPGLSDVRRFTPERPLATMDRRVERGPGTPLAGAFRETNMSIAVINAVDACRGVYWSDPPGQWTHKSTRG